MSRTALPSDEMWARIESLLPDRAPRRGGRWSDHRPVVEAISWRYRTGSPWRDLPRDSLPGRQSGGDSTVWAKNGTWDRVLLELQG
jgi:putative transposase